MNESKPSKIWIIVLIAVSLALVSGANAWKSSLVIKQIKIEGNRIISSNEIIQLTQIQTGSLLYKADLAAIQRNVMSHYYIKDAVVERNLPNTICIRITERIPIAMINRGETLYLDETGVILPRTISRKLFDLPIINGISANEAVNLGSAIKQTDVLESLQVLSILKIINRPMYHNISEVQVRNGGDMVLFSAEGGIPIIFGRGEIPDKIVRLEAFWNQIVRNQGPQNFQYIDLRFRDQIVVRWNSETTSKNL